MSNPYQSPVTPSSPQSGRREELRLIAQTQKNVIYVLLLRLILLPIYFAIFAALGPDAGWARPVITVIDLGVGILALVVIFQLASKVYSTAVGVVFALLACVPCIGLIMLLVANGKATSILQAEGIKVGLMGADMSQLQ